MSLEFGDLRLSRTEGYVKHLTIGFVVFLLLYPGGTRVEAQEVASSFDQLAVLVKPGDKITVVDVTGRESKGRIGKLSRDALILVTSAGPQQLGEVNVATISQRRGDSLKNGAIIGAVAGTVYFLTLAALLRDTDGGDVIVSTAVAGGVLWAGMGAAAGAGIDALISRRQVIYQRPAGRNQSQRFTAVRPRSSGRRSHGKVLINKDGVVDILTAVDRARSVYRPQSVVPLSSDDRQVACAFSLPAAPDTSAATRQSSSRRRDTNPWSSTT